MYQFDIRYTRSFFKLWEQLQPKFFIEANNIFNHPNITTDQHHRDRERDHGSHHDQPDLCAGVDASRRPHCAAGGESGLVAVEIFPAPVYAETVLSINFRDAQRFFLDPLIEIHYAHTLMLARQGIIPRPMSRKPAFAR